MIIDHECGAFAIVCRQLNKHTERHSNTLLVYFAIAYRVRSSACIHWISPGPLHRNLWVWHRIMLPNRNAEHTKSTNFIRCARKWYRVHCVHMGNCKRFQAEVNSITSNAHDTRLNAATIDEKLRRVQKCKAEKRADLKRQKEAILRRTFLQNFHKNQWILSRFRLGPMENSQKCEEMLGKFGTLWFSFHFRSCFRCSSLNKSNESVNWSSEILRDGWNWEIWLCRLIGNGIERLNDCRISCFFFSLSFLLIIVNNSFLWSGVQSNLYGQTLWHVTLCSQ